MSNQVAGRHPLDVVRALPAFAAMGMSRSAGYLAISRGLLMAPVRVGPRSSGFLAREIEALNAARAAGHTEQEIRALVTRLEAARVAVPTN